MQLPDRANGFIVLNPAFAVHGLIAVIFDDIGLLRNTARHTLKRWLPDQRRERAVIRQAQGALMVIKPLYHHFERQTRIETCCPRIRQRIGFRLRRLDINRGPLSLYEGELGQLIENLT